MRPTTTTVPGAARVSATYYTPTGRMRTAREPVPVDEYGRLAAHQYRCRRCHATHWYPIGTPTGADQPAPACPDCGRRMTPVTLGDAPLLPWRDLAEAAERPLRPIWCLTATATAGHALHLAHTPALAPALALAAPPAWEATRRAVHALLTRDATALGRLDGDPAAHRRRRHRAARTARAAAWATSATLAWAATATATGIDPATAGGAATLATLGLLGAWPAGAWWRRLRDQRSTTPQDTQTPAQEPTTDVDADELHARTVWTTRLARQRGEVLPDGTTATMDGPLAGTRLTAWTRITGGWQATIVGPTGRYGADEYVSARARIARAYKAHRSMVTIMPDGEDENRAMLLLQRESPLTDVVRWAGPVGVDPATGTAAYARYADGTTASYEMWRPGWGCPHDGYFGTTGSGKSEAIAMALTIGRWFQHPDRPGVGLVADWLVDPQQGQSYEPFWDDLAGPVATTSDEALLLAEAFTREGLRRNAYLSKGGWRAPDGTLRRAEWVDRHGRTRYGRKFWDPLIDGPILTLTIDEAHAILADKRVTQLIVAGARMFRKVGIKIRIGTQTPLLGDLGGSTPLRDMVLGGFVWCGRIANSLGGPIAFNGRIPVDPRSIPGGTGHEGTCFMAPTVDPKPMIARTMWEPDFYDWIRDADENPIGYPAVVPDDTLTAFGDDYRQWAQARRAGLEWTPTPPDTPAATPSPAPATGGATAVDAVHTTLRDLTGPADMNTLTQAMARQGWTYSTRTLREAIKTLRDRGIVYSHGGRHELVPSADDVSGQPASERSDERSGP